LAGLSGFAFSKTQYPVSREAKERFQDKWSRLSGSKTRPSRDFELRFWINKTESALIECNSAPAPVVGRLEPMRHARGKSDKPVAKRPTPQRQPSHKHKGAEFSNATRVAPGASAVSTLFIKIGV